MNRLSMWSLVVILLLVAGVSANAADFQGFYVGGTLGAAYGHSEAQTSTVFSPTGYFATTSVPAIALAGNQTLNPTRVTGAFEAGYNHQAGNWLFGVETEMGSMHLNDSASSIGTYPCCGPTGFTVTQTINTDWLFTLRGRAGFVIGGNVLLYGTGGLAVTDRNYDALFSDTFATAHESGGSHENAKGWVVGGGAEFKTGPHFSLKGEFLRVDFGDVTTTSNNLTAFSPPIAFPTNTFTHTASLKANLFRFGFNYHF